MAKDLTLPCIICNKKLESASEGDKYNQPHKGTTFESHGHYGSTVFDPMQAPEYLELNFCDSCLAGRIKQGKVLLRRDKKMVESTYTSAEEILEDIVY